MSRISKTHYDHFASKEPAIIKEINARALRMPDPERPLVMDEGIDRQAHRILMDSIIENGRVNLARRGYKVARMTGGEILSIMPEKIKEALWASLNQDFIHNLNFTLFGRKTFFFRENLVARLAETELNVDNELLEPPFKSCLFIYNDQCMRDALYAIHGLAAPDHGPISVYISKLPRGSDFMLAIYAVHNIGSDTRAPVVRQLILRSGQTIEDALRTNWEEEYRVSGEAPPNSAHLDVLESEKFFGVGFRLYRVVLNSILYLGSSHPDLSDLIQPPHYNHAKNIVGSARRQLERSSAHETRLSYIDVGRSVLPVEGIPQDTGSGRPLDHQVRVRGHWKSQAHGPGWSKRKIIRVEPYWKGPDAAEVISKNYVVR